MWMEEKYAAAAAYALTKHVWQFSSIKECLLFVVVLSVIRYEDNKI